MHYKALMFMSRCACCMPYGLLMWLGRILGNLYYLLIKKQRRRAIEQMQISLGLPEAETKRMVRESFVNLARNMLEILYMPHLNKENLSRYVTFEHLDRLEAVLAEGHGVVVITGHVGTWEWMSGGLALRGYPVTAIAKPQPNIEYTRALDDLRATVNVEIFSRGTSELLAAGRALKKGKILGFLMDQDAGPGGAFTEFLGRMASSPMGAAVFAKKFHAPALPMFILRQPDGGHKVVIGEIMRFEDTGDTDKDLFDFTVKATNIIEKVIRENPTQWIWFQKRWNTSLEQQKKDRHHTVKTREEQ